jgi:NAD+ kinase
MNKKSLSENDNFYESIINAQQFVINPLLAKITDINGKIYEKLAINDISITRKTSQTAKLQIFVDDVLRMPEMIGDGVLISTPIGSTAYNVSVGGPILPINCNLLAITPISPFRPRYWRGAMLDNSSVIKIANLSIENRPVSVTADFNSVRDVVDVEIILQKNIQVTMLFDNDFLIKDRIMREQFMVYN